MHTTKTDDEIIRYIKTNKDIIEWEKYSILYTLFNDYNNFPIELYELLFEYWLEKRPNDFFTTKDMYGNLSLGFLCNYNSISDRIYLLKKLISVINILMGDDKYLYYEYLNNDGISALEIAYYKDIELVKILVENECYSIDFLEKFLEKIKGDKNDSIIDDYIQLHSVLLK